uniref:Uncharacterized protein n=1 Tax=Romanomermis culicivorax TaxID=13658 RepID=A0A915HRW9_ROMCU
KKSTFSIFNSSQSIFNKSGWNFAIGTPDVLSIDDKKAHTVTFKRVIVPVLLPDSKIELKCSFLIAQLTPYINAIIVSMITDLQRNNGRRGFSRYFEYHIYRCLL